MKDSLNLKLTYRKLKRNHTFFIVIFKIIGPLLEIHFFAVFKVCVIINRRPSWQPATLYCLILALGRCTFTGRTLFCLMLMQTMRKGQYIEIFLNP